MIVGIIFYLIGGCGGGSDTSTTEATASGSESGATLSQQALVGSEIAVSTASGEQQNPFIIYLPDRGVYFVLWEDWRDITDSDVYGLFMDEQGNPCGGEFLVAGSSADSDNQTVPSAAYRPADGKIVVVWQDTRGNNAGGYIYYRSITNIPDSTTCAGFDTTTLNFGAETSVGFNEVQVYNPLPTANVVNEAVGTGDGTTTDFNTVTANSPIVPGTVVVRLNGNTVGVDNGAGSLTGDVTGNVDYATGSISIRFSTAPNNGDSITVDYSYYTSTIPTTSNLASDDLVSRLKPKIEYDKVNDRFWIVWVEIRNTLKRISEVCFYGTRSYIASWSFGDSTYVGYLRLDGATLGVQNSEIGVPGPDIIRNSTVYTVRLLSSSRGALNETYEYEYFDRIDNPDVSCDPTSGICLITFEGDRGRATLECSCSDSNNNNSCDVGEDVTDTLTQDNFQEDNIDPVVQGEEDKKHIFAIFSYQVSQGTVKSMRLDNSISDTGYPSVDVDPVTKRFLVAWEDRRDDPNNPKIYGSLVSSGAGLYGSDFIISYQDLDGDGQNDPEVVNSKQTRPYVEYDDVNQRFFVVWQDGRNQQTSLENLDIYGQYVDLEGSLRGVNHFISTNPANQLAPVIAYSASRNEFMAVWKDGRNTSTTGSDIYAQRFTIGQPVLLLLDASRTTLLAPAILDFGTIEAGKTSSLSFIIKNGGDTTLNLDCVVLSGDPVFTLDPAPPPELQNCDGTTLALAPGATTPINVLFSPSSEGIYSGQIDIRSDGGNKILALSGSATAKPVYSLRIIEGDGTNDGTLDFGNVKVGNSKTLTLTVQNNGNVNITVSSITIADPYFTATPTVITITPGGQEIVRVTFNGLKDLIRGSYTSSMLIATDASGVSVTLNLQGRIVAPVLRIDQTTLDFGQVNVGSFQDLNLTIYNDGDADMNVISCGTPPQGFSIVNCPSTVPAGGNATITYRFSPTDTISYSGTVTVETDGGNQDITLQGLGRGAKIEVSQTVVDFGTVAVGLKKTIVVDVKNLGNDVLVINNITDPGAPFTLDKPSTTFPINVNPGTSVTILANFQPAAEGYFTDSFAIQSNAGNVTVQLQGTGKQVIVVDEGDGANDGILYLPDVKITTGFSYTGSQQRITITNGYNQAINFTATENSDEYRVYDPALDVIPDYFEASRTTFTLNPGESKTLVVDFRPTQRGTYTTQLLVTTDIAGLQRSITLTGKGTAPVLRIDQTTLDFGQVNVGSFQDLNLTIYNDGDADMNVISCGTPPQGFSIVNCPSTVPAGGNATITYRFSPTDTISYSGTVTVETDGGNQDITLQGQGKGPKIEVSQTVVDFGYVVTNSSGSMNIEIRNTGNNTLTINQIDTTGLDPAFSVSFTGTLPITLQPGTSMNLLVSFNPSTEGFYSGSFTVRSNALNGDVTINLQGFGIAVNVDMPSTVDFGSVQVNETVSQQVIITNNSTRTIKIIQIDSPSQPFQLSSVPTVPVTLNPGDSVSMVVSFSPTEAGTYSSYVTVLFDFSSTPSLINLTGTATGGGGVSLGAIQFQKGGSQITTLYFGKVLLRNSKVETITLVNTGSSDVQIVSVSATQPYRVVESSFTVPAGGTKDLDIFFEPVSNGLLPGTLQLQDSAGNTYTLSLSGEGTDVVVSSSPGLNVSFSRHTFTSAPSGVIPRTGVSFVITGTFSGPVPVNITMSEPPQDLRVYKYVNGTWKEIYPNNECNGISNVSFSGNTLSFNIQDNSECDLSGTNGKIVDPILIGSGVAAGAGQPSETVPPPSSQGESAGCSTVPTGFDTGLLTYAITVMALLLRRLRRRLM